MQHELLKKKQTECTLPFWLLFLDILDKILRYFWLFWQLLANFMLLLLLATFGIFFLGFSFASWQLLTTCGCFRHFWPFYGAFGQFWSRFATFAASPACTPTAASAHPHPRICSSSHGDVGERMQVLESAPIPTSPNHLLQEPNLIQYAHPLCYLYQLQKPVPTTTASH